MSIKIGGDILIHLKKLTNLDCFSYGQYRIKVEAWRQSDSKKNPKDRTVLPPYFIPMKPYDNPQASKFKSPSIAENSCQYLSQTIIFKSNTESVV